MPISLQEWLFQLTTKVMTFFCYCFVCVYALYLECQEQRDLKLS